VFGGADGTLVLEELKKNFSQGFSPDPYIHAYNAGQCSVIKFIEKCMSEDIEEARKKLERKEDGRP